MTEPQLEAGGDTAADGMMSTADSITSSESGQNKTDKVDLESNVELEEDARDFNLRQEDVVRQGLFQNEEDDRDSGTDYFNSDMAGTQLQRDECVGDASLPDTFQTNELLYYERFKAYQDYMLGDCKTSEVKAFTADYLEKVLEPCDWQAQWCTDVFDVLVEVVDVNCKELKAKVKLVVPLQCETRGCELTEAAMNTLLEATLHKVPLQELHVVFDESGDFDQTALALEHLRFFYKHIWRQWDEEEENDDFDYFVRCVEPRLRLFYDILEDRVPAGLVAEYYSLLARCSQKFHEFSSLRNGISSDSESELDNVSMVEGLRMYEQMEALKRKLRIIENPLLRYVLGYKVNSGQQSCRAKGPRVSGGRMVHVVSVSTTVSQLQSLIADKLGPEFSGEEFEVQFYSEPLLAVSACYEGDVVIVLPGHYNVTSSISIPDSISVEGFGLPDEVVIEKKNKGDSFVESTGADVKVSNIKFIQHDAIEGILCVRQGKLEMENCVLQCETTGVIVRTSAHLTMNMCDLYGSKGAGVEIYPGSVCRMVGNGIHHCKEGILIKDFADELDTMPRITMVNNVIHNNEGYGVILVKPSDAVPGEVAQEDTPTDEQLDIEGNEDMKGEGKMQVGVDVQLIVVDDCSVKEPVPYSSCYVVPPEFTEGNDAIKRELGVTQADDNLLSQEMFVSIQDNQFRRNGMGSFGTFLY
ncbi:SHC SH2 domain-binding protein 1 [Salmo salar]|uniref:SHC SH2 domain-binding protein 1 n=1 Tax=Salmo salar TaxID=8030 RepID=A0A1S3PTL3_SALSA|nr:SHC SH2 domain-binding protein 1 [Salmo salar]|eukprot:XP_014031033.1 PREDICTED: SHC SH2 domain-binding protein 1-like [Salmo salar]